MLALTMGDPAGIGPELILRAWRLLRDGGPAFVALADPAQLAALDPGVPLQLISDPADAEFAQGLPVLEVPLAAPATPGHADPRNAGATLASIERAVRLAQERAVTGVVTNPISKAVLYAAGFPHPGHTEFLGALTGCARPVMMLANDHLRVVPVTVHVSLRRAVEELTTEAILHAARTAAEALRQQFGLAAPRLAVAGLNPHAGEGGAMGDEEARIVQPAIDALRAEGLQVSGPHPPDTLFTPGARAGYDVAICLYHDQALIPLKTLDMASGVNVTLGLPIVRTSPDHGTAFDIAGAGLADPASLLAALRLAARLGVAGLGTPA